MTFFDRLIAPLGVLFFYLLCSVQERYDLAASAGRVRGEVRCVRALGYTVCDCPFDGLVAIRADGYVNKAVASADCRFTFGAVHERYHLTARAGRVRREVRCIGSLGYAVCDCPFDGLVAVRAGRYVNKSDVSADGRLTCGAPEEGHDLSASAACVRREVRRIRALR